MNIAFSIFHILSDKTVGEKLKNCDIVFIPFGMSVTEIEKAEEICPGRCIKLKKYNSSRRLIAELLAGRSRNIEEDVELQTIIASLPKGVGLKIYGMDQLHLNESPITIIL